MDSLTIPFVLLGWLTAIAINALADDLPQRRRPTRPHCPHCQQTWAGPRGSGLIRWLTHYRCPACGAAERRRPVITEVGTAVLYGLLPNLIEDPRTLVVITIYVAILVLILVIDLEHLLILHIVTFPATVLALVASVIVPAQENTLPSALVGAVLGFVFFYGAYRLGRRLFGPGALGFGDVTLSMLLGAMLGFDRIFFALILAILLGGVISLGLLLTRRHGLRTHLPYGPYLVTAGILMLLWGHQVVEWYLGPLAQ